jgi:hypothetical protein
MNYMIQSTGARLATVLHVRNMAAGGREKLARKEI